MKVKRRLESIINVPGQQSVGRLNSLLSCKELQSAVYTEYAVRSTACGAIEVGSYFNHLRSNRHAYFHYYQKNPKRSLRLIAKKKARVQ